MKRVCKHPIFYFLTFYMCSESSLFAFCRIGYNSRFLPEIMDECLVFFFHECGEVPPPTGQTSNPIRLGEKNVSNRTLEGEKDKTRKISSEMITNFLIPELLSTTVKGIFELCHWSRRTLRNT